MTALKSSDSPFSVSIDSKTGMPNGLIIEDSKGEISRSIAVSMSVEIGGTEHRNHTGGLYYKDTETLSNLVPTSKLKRLHKGVYEEYNQAATLGPLGLVLHYRLYPTAPYFELAVTFESQKPVVIRNANVEINFEPGAKAKINAPGNLIRRDLPISDMGDSGLGISTLANLRGSSGIVGVSDSEATLTIWPNQPTEMPYITVTKVGSSISITGLLNFAAEISAESSAELLVMTFNLDRGDFELVREQWPAWASRYGLTSPNDPPSWIHGAGIYEVQIGTSYFWKNHAYCRYEEIRDLIADLDRVQKLGFSVIQLMPRQPYPSYNVPDYADVTVSYGQESELRELVKLCHGRGMRVILDVLLHGVLDNESIDAAVKGVVDGPIYADLEREVGDTFATDVNDEVERDIHWSRHILDFSDYWRGGSPKRTPLQESNPDWFATDTAGNVGGVYTKAFDARNPSWQRYFRESMMNLIRNYDVDGFRFDAPTYNFFANWAPWAKSRAFMSPLGCIPLFVDMRHDMKREKPDALLYTEPSGLLLRRSMDVNYNYDEQWLVSALMSGSGAERAVRNGRDFMTWIQDRDDFLPIGAQTAHHIDSHDTFWWPQWGKKWRREQFSITATKALAASFLALDGPYMMFTGGEEGIEEALGGLLNFRNDNKDLWEAKGQFDTQSDPTEQLIIVTRTLGNKQVVSIINTSTDKKAKLPAGYLGLSSAVQNGVNNDQLEPLGYLFASRKI